MAVQGCPICQHIEVVDFQVIGGRRVLICTDCRHMFWAEMPSSAELAHFYATEFGHTHHQRRIQFDNVAYYERHLGELLAFYGSERRDLTIVDFGCSYPCFLDVARQRGFTRLIGVDWDEDARAYGRERGIRMVTPQEFERDIRPGTIDIIRISHTLEHLPDPLAVMINTRRKLNSGATVYITQPSFPAFAPRIADSGLSNAVWPEHLHFFSPISLYRLIQRSGLRIDRLFTFQNVEAVLAQYSAHLDIPYAAEALASVAELCGELFEGASGYPTYAGENSVVYATHALSAASHGGRHRLVSALRRIRRSLISHS